MILAATGHRPVKLGGYGAYVFARLKLGARHYLADAAPDRVISGMALGWDQAWAWAAVDLGIPFVAAMPFYGQETQWPEESRERYHDLLEHAAEVVTVCEGGYAPWKMQRRNEWMVDHCDKMIALWDGSNGGTANCVRYAERVGKPVENLWPQWRGGHA